ncbi:hypothetical protein HY485_00770 [Candidatus Woesearchaeota archaeon]|nr:hypothetical protein [Candidatus Woesearchaeota archaeon]
MAINPLYKDIRVLTQAKEKYKQETPNNIRLQAFFQPAVFALLQKKLLQQKYTTKFHPYKYHYSTTKMPEIEQFLRGTYFQTIVANLLSIKKYNLHYEIQRFKAGNFTLLHDTEKEQPATDFIIDFSTTETSNEGYTKYLTEREELLQLNPCPNSLSFVERNKTVMHYIKYITHKQKEPFIFVRGTIQQL